MYIRTKDGVYVLSEAYWAGNKDEIIAQADTIEELCDYFYIDTGNLEDKSWYTHSQYIEILRDVCVFGTENIEIEAYGIIKTSKGLIYVAKMDSEGKLVLI